MTLTTMASRAAGSMEPGPQWPVARILTGCAAAVTAVGVAALAAALVIGAPAAPAAAAGYSLPVAPVVMDWIDNCFPASSSMYLSAFGIHVSQDELAVEMHTYQNRGTVGADGSRVVNEYLASRNLKVVGVEGLAGRRLAATLTAQMRAGHPVMLAVRGNLMPWRRGAPVTVHIIIATGIRGQTVQVFDPSAVYGGWYSISIRRLSPGLVAALVTLSRR